MGADDIAEFLAATPKFRKSLPTSVLVGGQVRPLVDLRVAEIRKAINDRRREADAIEAWLDWRAARYQAAKRRVAEHKPVA